ncbi:MOSC domain-containing protein [Microlunatus parietis]|uniref:MOSC domain-containing protein YiiM n=1 Tax=Microlunatus parietis TaxID=682979 RepID=A0A7Y9I751_9ACTN|nr:MOSC domain-containing protein [Microlunatus parietis]NYE71226.1 MOSC domain-containing protein YiiM [Microlunatus parietis]
MGYLASINVGRAAPNPYKAEVSTGIDKRPVDGPVQVRPPGPKHGGLGSGLVGDFIGDRKNHGGDDQALYVFQREDLAAWSERLGRELAHGYFGENLTTGGIDVNEARIGERWRIGAQVVVQVTSPRIPCATFRGWTGERGWLKHFVRDRRPGTYLRIIEAGELSAGDPIEVIHRPDHDVTIAYAFAALIDAPELLPGMLAAGREDLGDELHGMASRGETFSLG